MRRIVARFTLDDSGYLAFDRLSVLHDGLAVALHLKLLQLCRKALQAVIVRQDGQRR
jgi:hypothetical protein